MSDFYVFESIDGTALLKNVIGADKDDILFLEIAVGFPFVQGFRVAQSLVIASTLWQFMGIFYLHLTPMASAAAAQS